MDIQAAKQVMLRTHMAALRHETRANALLLESGPGIGKSDGTFQYAQEMARQLKHPVGVVQFMLATISSVDVRGFMLPVKGADKLDTVFSTPPWFPTKGNTHVVDPDGTWHKPGTTEPPATGVLFLDELGQAEDETKKAAAELIYKGAVGTCELPPAWRVVAAQNRMIDRSGVLRELMFLVNRRCRLSIDASLPAWIEWANAQPPASRPHYLTLSFAQKNPDIVFRDAVPEGTDPFCTPRTLCLLDKDLRALRSDDEERDDKLPTDPIAREVAAGWIGGGSAAQLFTHIKYADELPDIADIIKAPMKAKLPARRDVQMVAGYMLAHAVTEKNAGAFILYIERMNIEMQILTMSAIVAQADRVTGVVAQDGFTRWLMANKDVFIAARC